MRHNNKINHLGRTYSHRDAMLSNMAVSLIKHKRIFTTLAKAKELRKYIEPIITKSREDTTHSRRVAFQSLRDKYAVTELFIEISQKIGDRPGGYTRIIKTGNRLGDNASMCFIELVDYNELMLKDKKAPAKAKTRRSRRRSDATDATEINPEVPKASAPTKKAKVEKTAEEAPVVPAEEAPVAKKAAEIVETTGVEAVAEIAEIEPVEQKTPTEEKPEAPAAESSETEETK